MLAQPSGVLRVSMPEGFANIFLAPLIADFARSYPGIRFEFDLSPRSVDLVSEPVDVAIRMGEPPSSNLIARQLARLPVSYTHLRAHETVLDLVCRLLLEKKQADVLSSYI